MEPGRLQPAVPLSWHAEHASPALLFSFGHGHSGQLGHGDFASLVAPRMVTSAAEGIVAVSAGFYHALALTAAGRVLSWGHGGQGRLGHGDCAIINVPKLMAGLESVRIGAVSAGGNHSILLADDGAVFTLGRGDDGQLGHEDGRNYATPRKVAALQDTNIVAVAAGGWHSAFLTDGGVVVTCGRNYDGQLGRSGGSNVAPVPLTGPVTAISAGGWHTLMLTSDGVVLTTGNGGTGHTFYAPVVVQGLGEEKATSVSAGFFHSAIVTTKGHMFTLGDGGSGRLGHGDLTRQECAKQVVGVGSRHVGTVAAGGAHTLVVTREGQVMTCGRGGLGFDEYTPMHVPLPIPGFEGRRVIGVASGNHYSLVLTCDPWTPENHKLHPKRFREVVKTLLLMRERPTEEDSAAQGWWGWWALPLELTFSLIEELAC